jgi:uncharacterized alkaline shock family protein YloU
MSPVSRESDRGDYGEDAAALPSRSGWLSRRITDVTIATIVAERVRALPGVADLSCGHAALIATYSAMQRVTGVAVRRPTPDEMSLEVHVIMRADARRPEAARDRDAHSAIIPAVAARIREVIRAALQDMSLPQPSEIDVFIDDIDIDGD